MTKEQRLNSGPSDKEKAIPVTIGGEGEDKNTRFSLSATALWWRSTPLRSCLMDVSSCVFR